MDQKPLDATVTWLAVVAERIANSGHADEGIQAAVQAVKDILGARTVALLLLDDSQENLYIRASRGLSPSYVASFSRPVGAGIAAEIALSGMALALSDPELDPAAYADVRLERDFGSAMAVGLVSANKPVGLLYCDRDECGHFGKGALQTLRCLGLLASIAMEKQQLQETVARLAVTDPATGLFSYNHFRSRLADDIARSLRYGGTLGLLVFEIAHVAGLAEAYGRLAAEEALRCAAEVVRENTRSIDYGARYGADQIAVALIRADGEGLRGVAGRIAARIEDVSFICPATPALTVPDLRLPEVKRAGPTCCVSAYIAAAVAPEHGRNLQDLTASLEKAMSAAKSRGVGRVSFPGE